MTPCVHSLPAARRGTVLVVVLIVVAMLTLGVYRFTGSMTTEEKSTASLARWAQARACAQSALDWTATWLDHRFDDPEAPVQVFDNPELFQAVPLDPTGSASGKGYFSVVAPWWSEDGSGGIRYGLSDESARLDLNALVYQWQLEPEQQQQVLMQLPGMTVELADAILDWIDADSEPRQFGAEDEYYGALQPPYTARNARLQSLEELLLVRGMTPQLLFGEDTNRNGVLDPNENDGDASPPADNADGVLDRGLAAYLTLWSRHRNRRQDGSQRINVNSNDLAALYDQLAQEFDEDVARFVVAYRLFGPVGGGSTSTPLLGTAGPRGGTAPGGASGPGGQSGSRGSGPRQTRGGLDLSRGGQQQIPSIYHLIGVQVRAQINGSQQTLESPWPDEPAQLQEVLPRLLDTLTTSDEPYLAGRINVLLAPRPVLQAIPEMPEELIEPILAAQAASGVNQGTWTEVPGRETTAWLYLEGVASLEQMRQLAPYIGGGGDAFRVQAVGYLGSNGPVVRLEALLDASAGPARVIWLRELSPLGPGFSPAELAPVVE